MANSDDKGPGVLKLCGGYQREGHRVRLIRWCVWS